MTDSFFGLFDLSQTVILSLTLISLTLFSAFFSCSEIALFSLPLSKTRSWKLSKERSKTALYELLSYPKKLLVLIFMLNTIVNVLLQNVSSNIFDTPGIDFFGKILLPFLIILFFGELIPKWVGMRHNMPIALFSSPIYLFLLRFLGPVQNGLIYISELCSRFFFFFLKPERALHTHELEAVVKDAVANGVLQQYEARLISNWIEIESKNALDIMIPISYIKIFILDQSSVCDLKQLITHTNETKSPINGVIIGSSSDTPIGFLQYQDLLNREERVEPLLELARRQLFFIPETMKARKLILEFQSRKNAAACVVDEYDRVTGFLSYAEIEERLLKRTVIPSTLDETPGLQIINPYSLITAGTTPIDIINNFFNRSLISQHRSTTIGGWLIEQSDTIPKPGFAYASNGLFFRVLASTPRKIETIFISLKKDDHILKKPSNKTKKTDKAATHKEQS